MESEFTDYQSVIFWLEFELKSNSDLVWNKLSDHLQKNYDQERLMAAYKVLDARLVAHLFLGDEIYEPIWKEVVDYMETLWHAFTIESIESKRWLAK